MNLEYCCIIVIFSGDIRMLFLDRFNFAELYIAQNEEATLYEAILNSNGAWWVVSTTGGLDCEILGVLFPAFLSNFRINLLTFN